MSDIQAVILAGGKGTRLRPFTYSLPKPLMPVGEQPVMEILVRDLVKAGITEIIVATGYLSHLIKAYFGDGQRFDCRIRYSHEGQYMLGTAGPLKAAEELLSDPFIAVNGDTLTDLDWKAFIDHHVAGERPLTVGAVWRSVKIDLGVIEVDRKGVVTWWDEKPEKRFLAAMGAYVINKEALDHLAGGHSDLPDLVKWYRNRAGSYIHTGSWLDIGRPEDYATACRLAGQDDLVA